MNRKDKVLEYHRVGKEMEKIDRVYIYGCGKLGHILYEILKQYCSELYFIDSDPSKWGDHVLSPQTFQYETPKTGTLTVVAAAMPGCTEIEKNLWSMGLIRHKDYFIFDEFMSKYLKVYLTYRHGISRLDILDISLTQKCNLKCKDCSILTPYIENPVNRSLDEVLNDVDLLFSRVDFIEKIYLIGGEPLLYPEINMVCRQLKMRYKEQYGILFIATNGLVKISEKTLNTFKECGVRMQISDYSKTNAAFLERIDRFVGLLENFGIPYDRMREFQWVNYGFRGEDREETEIATAELFTKCGIDCRAMEKGRLYYCFPAMMVNKAMNIQQDPENIFDLRNVEEGYKKRLLEFDMGSNERGYLKMCRRCNGSYLLNKRYIPAAEQL